MPLTDSIEITTNLNEATDKELRQKYNEVIAEVMMSEIHKLPKEIRKPVLEELKRCLTNNEDDVYSEKPVN